MELYEFDDLDDTLPVTIWQPLLGLYPYILIQFEKHDGEWRLGIDYDLMSAEEVIDTLEEIIRDVKEQEWTEN